MKTKLFDYIFESSIKSSKTIIGIVTELIEIANDIEKIRVSLISLSKVVQTHQKVLDDIIKALEHAAAGSKKSDITFPSINDPKKDKPN